MCLFVCLYPTSHLAGGVQVLDKARNLRLDGLKAISRTAESNLDALNTVDFGPKRPFCVDEGALWARLTRRRFAAQVSAVVGLVEVSANHYKVTAVAKVAIAIKYGNTTGNSIKSSSRRPSPASTPSSCERAPRRRWPGQK
jgi:hypothetical protein